MSGTSEIRGRAGTISERAVDVTLTVLAGWLMTGVYLDAWAHISRLPDSFWTPWHAILYSGLMACGVFLFVVRGTSYRRSSTATARRSGA